MLRHKIKHVIVVEKGKPIGILSMKNITKVMAGRGGAIEQRRPIDDSPAARVIGGKLITASLGTDVKKAASMMLNHGTSCLPIARGNELVGVVTKTDIARYFASNMVGRAKIRGLMTSKVVTANRRSSLQHILRLMEQNNISRVVITDGELPIGIITAADIAFAELEKPAEGTLKQMVRFTRKAERASRPRCRYVKYVSATAENLMRQELLTISADDDAAVAANIMLERGISGLPVVEGDKLVGIITKTDLTRGVAELG
jgi:CBS domain-containing protein